MAKTVLITGGAGFIGSHVAELFLENDWTVIIVDNLSTGKRGNVPPDACFYEGNADNEVLLERIFSTHPINVIIHLAAHVSVRASIENPVTDAQSNIIAGLTFLEAARKAGVSSIIFSSTGGVIYGHCDDLPVSESRAPNPVSPYGISKLAFEHYLRFYSEIHGFKCIVLRYANVFGPRQGSATEAGVVDIFIRRLLQNQPVDIFGDGDQTRDFLYVRDIANANLLVAERFTGDPSFEIYNVGSGKETSVNEIYSELCSALPKPSEARYLAAIPGELRRISLLSDRFCRRYGWCPEYDLKTGLRETIGSVEDELREALE